MTLENDALKTQVEKLTTKTTKESAKLKEQEEILAQCHEKISVLVTEGDRTTTDLKCQVEELSSAKHKLEEDFSRLRNKLSSLQVELDNSEAVQRDFVKLSQSLQVKTEDLTLVI